jgi:chromate transporter
MIPLAPLAAIFAGLSLLAFGGGNTILPELQRALVTQHHWMTEPAFTALYGLAQAAPGPNMIIVTLLGWRLAGLPGAAAATLASFLPSALLTIAVLRVWNRAADARWRTLAQRGLVPVTTGLVAASAWIIARGAASSPVLVAVVAAAALLSATTRLHPLWLLGAGAMVAVLAG